MLFFFISLFLKLILEDCVYLVCFHYLFVVVYTLKIMKNSVWEQHGVYFGVFSLLQCFMIFKDLVKSFKFLILFQKFLKA